MFKILAKLEGPITPQNAVPGQRLKQRKKRAPVGAAFQAMMRGLRIATRPSANIAVS
jgi:hypothetical protein